MAAAVLVATFAVIPAAGSGSAAAADPCGVTIRKADGSAWTCSFADDFNGYALDSTKWVSANTAANGYRFGNTCFDPRRNIAVYGGTLHLAVTRRTAASCPGLNSLTSAWVGGAVSSWGRFSQTYGRFEARLKYPSRTTAGLHGGFWMNPRDHVYGSWPGSGEIDIAEWMSAVDRVVPSLHFSGRTKADTGWSCDVEGTDSFHTYGLVWSPTQMQFFYDGRLCFTDTWSPTNVAAPAPFDRPFVPSLMATAGLIWNAPTAGDPAYGVTQVDYVRVWR